MRPAFRRSGFLAAAICVSAAVVLSLRFASFEPEGRQQSIDLVVVQEMLSSVEPTSRYRLITDSIMTGFCWRTEDGRREGVFRDVNAGMAHWRDHAPDTAARHRPSGKRPALSGKARAEDLEMLSRQLDRLSFEAVDYTPSERSVQVVGELVIGDHSREVTLRMRTPKEQAGDTGNRDMIVLNATAELPADGLDAVPAAFNGKPLKLCMTMQAVRESVLPDSIADRPLVLSHYYQ